MIALGQVRTLIKLTSPNVSRRLSRSARFCNYRYEADRMHAISVDFYFANKPDFTNVEIQWVQFQSVNDKWVAIIAAPILDGGRDGNGQAPRLGPGLPADKPQAGQDRQPEALEGRRPEAVVRSGLEGMVLDGSWKGPEHYLSDRHDTEQH